MSRYFFHTADGVRICDREGTDLDDLDAARDEAIRLGGALIKDDPTLVKDQDFKVEVADETGLMLFMVMISTIDAPASVRRRSLPM